jgi:RNA polymerase sigma factor (sigma-70 family)
VTVIDTVPAQRGHLDLIAARDDMQWADIVAEYSGVVRGAARSVLRTSVDVDDACQRTWIALMKHANSIIEPAALPGWLATTARREALSILRTGHREVPAETADERTPAPMDQVDPSLRLLDEEISEALRDAIAELPATQRTLMEALLAEDASYDSVSADLGMPRGSIGPTRARALVSLRRSLASYAD